MHVPNCEHICNKTILICVVMLTGTVDQGSKLALALVLLLLYKSLTFRDQIQMLLKSVEKFLLSAVFTKSILKCCNSLSGLFWCW